MMEISINIRDATDERKHRLSIHYFARGGSYIRGHVDLLELKD